MSNIIGWISTILYVLTACLAVSSIVADRSDNIDTKLSSVIPFGLGIFSFCLASVFGLVWLLVR